MENVIRMLSVLLTLALVGCTQIQAYQMIEQSFDKELYTTIGGIVLKVRKTRDLPNVFGRADVWGGKVDEGFIELRYQNLNEDGMISFTMTDISILTDEDVFSRYLGGNKKTITLQTFSNPYANTSTTTGVISDRQRKEATSTLAEKFIYTSRRQRLACIGPLERLGHGIRISRQVY